MGRYDILVYRYDLTIPPVILELKAAQKFKELDNTCEEALRQITEKKYDFDLVEEGYTEVICYGIAFFKKQVKIHVERHVLEEE